MCHHSVPFDRCCLPVYVHSILPRRYQTDRIGSPGYLQDIHDCGACNTNNGNKQATQLSDWTALRNSCADQKYAGADATFGTRPKLQPSGQCKSFPSVIRREAGLTEQLPTKLLPLLPPVVVSLLPVTSETSPKLVLLPPPADPSSPRPALLAALARLLPPPPAPVLRLLLLLLALAPLPVLALALALAPRLPARPALALALVPLLLLVPLRLAPPPAARKLAPLLLSRYRAVPTTPPICSPPPLLASLLFSAPPWPSCKSCSRPGRFPAHHIRLAI